MKFKEYDVIVVGAGFSGAVMAERFASQQNKKVLVLDKREHVAGNCYDKVDTNGVVVHQYGPHLFHTRHEDVWQYLSQFTDWHPYEHKVLAKIDGQLAPVPFNLNSLHAFYPKNKAEQLERLLISKYGENSKIPILDLKQTDEPRLQQLADFIYNKLFVNYTCKQWGCTPEEISPSVTARVPVVLNRDDRYFHDKYQAIPKNGYTALINNILSHPNITIATNVDAKDYIALEPDSKSVLVEGDVFNGLIVYTGMLDELFSYGKGELPYRSLQFQFEQHDVEFYQPATTVNYPNEENFTRITEFKHILSQQLPSTTIVKEFPQDYDKSDPNCNIPYYPVFNEQSQAAYHVYANEIEKYPKIIALGRLAQYKYFNMDDAVKNALDIFSSGSSND
ncbi:UDP-galactopyranose mutase [Saccharobesus litoralis]|uniref:UDP-galactopyranose mutase n=1 Tax=Saccharobesus litoralis TaxID=2172099 RepID=A0A2S0VUA4_9ALTE|nr:UDP-galactopyranose mutase [Saccharobesus litoralis]AWB67785.1 UDP-galactopyranose mutase [Saccharobesus litoralis]